MLCTIGAQHKDTIRALLIRRPNIKELTEGVRASHFLKRNVHIVVDRSQTILRKAGSWGRASLISTRGRSGVRHLICGATRVTPGWIESNQSNHDSRDPLEAFVNSVSPVTIEQTMSIGRLRKKKKKGKKECQQSKVLLSASRTHSGLLGLKVWTGCLQSLTRWVS